MTGRDKKFSYDVYNAAPDLYQELVALVGRVEPITMLNDSKIDTSGARRAIAKAEGNYTNE